MDTPTIIVTRPLAQAEILSKKLAVLGRKSEIFPLLDILSLQDNGQLDAVLSRLSDFALVAFVSPNAVHAVFSRMPQWPRNLPIAVMGAGSRAALAEHGVSDANSTIISPSNPDRTDSETLLDVLDLSSLRDKEVLIVRGESGRELLADALRSQGVAVRQIAAYRRLAPVLTQTRKQRLKQLLDIDNEWVITSSEALRILISWCKEIDGACSVAKMQRQKLIVPHQRIEETAQNFGFQSITLTGSGDESLFVALQSTL